MQKTRGTAGMELLIDIPEESCIIEADEIQFSRVIVNLMTNAIRHNEKENRVADTGDYN